MKKELYLDDVVKEKLNIIIPYYRKNKYRETGNEKWTQKNFFFDEALEVPICSCTTYSKMENNKLRVDEEVYSFALEKLEKRYTSDKGIQKRYEKIVHQIYHAATYYDCNQIYRIYQKNREFLFSSYNTVIYEEYSFALLAICRYYIKGIQISEYEFKMLDELFYIYPIKLQELIKKLFFFYANVLTESDIEYVYKKYNYALSEFIPNKICYILQLMFTRKEQSAITEIQELIPILRANNNVNYLVLLYIYLANRVIYTDRELCDTSLSKAFALLSEYDIPSKRKKSVLNNIASVELRLKNYEIAKRCIENCIKLDNNTYTKRNISILCFCNHMMNEPIEAGLFTLANPNADRIDTLLYEYYHDLEMKSDKDNVVFIMKELIPYLTMYDSLYIFMLEQELVMLCKSTRQFKSYYEFKRIFEG